MDSSDNINERVTAAVTKQLNDNDTLVCPACLTYGERQPLSREGDDLTRLFCPHCNLTFQISTEGWPHHYRSRTTTDWFNRITKEGEIRCPASPTTSENSKA